MKISPIKTEKQYNIALTRIEELWGSKSNTKLGDKLDVLLVLVEHYESNNIKPIVTPDPLSALEFVMEQKGYTQKDLAFILGPTRASEILKGKKQLNLKQIILLNSNWNVPYNLFIDNHPLKEELTKADSKSKKLVKTRKPKNLKKSKSANTVAEKNVKYKKKSAKTKTAKRKKAK
jgi:HTH-type transcriptional regulator/antitoxin HigA